MDQESRLKLLKEVLPAQVQLAEERVQMQTFFAEYEKRNKEQAYDTTGYRESSKYFNRQYKEAIYAAQLRRFRAKLAALPLSEEAKAIIVLSVSPEDIWQIPQYAEAMRPTLKLDWALALAEKDWTSALEKIKATQSKLSKIVIAEEDSGLGEPLGVLPSGITYYQATQDSVEHLLSALRGAHPEKAIILDVWATWCGPCIMDMKNEKTPPNLQKLSNMDVEVVYLCTSSGSDVDTWKKKVAELGIGKQHIFLSDRLSIEMMQYFNLRGYPSHVFLDKDGQLVPNVLHGIRNVDFDKVKDALAK